MGGIGIKASWPAQLARMLLGMSAAQTPLPSITPAEVEQAGSIYFNRCPGCHEVTRKGATGPTLSPEKIQQRGAPYIEAAMFGGLPGGTPDWGRQGVLNPDQIKLMARFLMNEVVVPPQLSFSEIQKSRKLLVPPDKRPDKPLTKRNWENHVGVILRDAGKMAVVYGDAHELVTIFNTGFATYILRSSKSGRYFYVIGRDGKTTLVGLWPEIPNTVAEVRPCLDARSVESSKYPGFVDRYAVTGCY